MKIAVFTGISGIVSFITFFPKSAWIGYPAISKFCILNLISEVKPQHFRNHNDLVFYDDTCGEV